MEDYKIIQIIPNNKELYAKLKNIDGSFFTSPIVCFALTEDSDGDREVIPMIISNGDGEIHEIPRDQLDSITEKPLIYAVK